MLVNILDTIYIIYILFPVVLLFLKKKYLQKIRDYLKIIFLIYIIAPLMWIICDGYCIISILSNYIVNNYNNKETNLSHFNETYLKHIYKPILIVFNIDYEQQNIHKITSIISYIPILIMYYVSFYKVFE